MAVEGLKAISCLLFYTQWALITNKYKTGNVPSSFVNFVVCFLPKRCYALGGVVFSFPNVVTIHFLLLLLLLLSAHASIQCIVWFVSCPHTLCCYALCGCCFVATHLVAMHCVVWILPTHRCCTLCGLFPVQTSLVCTVWLI